MGFIHEFPSGDRISDIEHCKKMIDEQKQRVRDAPTPEAAESHRQLIMLYMAQFDIMNRRSAAQICSPSL